MNKKIKPQEIYLAWEINNWHGDLFFKLLGQIPDETTAQDLDYYPGYGTDVYTGTLTEFLDAYFKHKFSKG